MKNAEFQRQLWMRWRPSTWLWSLGLVALVLAVPLAISSAEEALQNLGLVAIFGVWGAALIYGSVLTTQSLSDEAQENTWDGQRLSALTPWQLAWGKLLGASLPAWWYAAWFALAALFVDTTWASLVGDGHHGIHLVALAVLSGLSLQAWGMNSVLLGWGGQPSIQPGRSGRRSVLWLGLLVLFILPVLLGPGAELLRQSALQWWGWSLSGLGFAYLCSMVGLGLGLLALWRQMRLYLDVPSLPWAWPLGLVVLGLLLTGLLPAEKNASVRWGVLTALALVATGFIALQHMESHLRAWRQVQIMWRQGQWRRAAQALPLWPVSWLLALVASLPASAQSGWIWPILCLWVLRDCLLITGFALARGRIKNPMASLMVAWVVLNLLLPMLAWGIGGEAWGLSLQPFAWILFKEHYEETTLALWAWLSIVIQLGLVALWLARVARSTRS